MSSSVGKRRRSAPSHELPTAALRQRPLKDYLAGGAKGQRPSGQICPVDRPNQKPQPAASDHRFPPRERRKKKTKQKHRTKLRPFPLWCGSRIPLQLKTAAGIRDTMPSARMDIARGAARRAAAPSEAGASAVRRRRRFPWRRPSRNDLARHRRRFGRRRGTAGGRDRPMSTAADAGRGIQHAAPAPSGRPRGPQRPRAPRAARRRPTTASGLPGRAGASAPARDVS